MLINVVVSVLSLVFVLAVLILVHEGGHFLAARWVGAPVSVFSIGFGKRLWGFKRGQTDYRVSAIPLGGYVRIHGLGPDESDLVSEDHVAEELLPRWKRTIVLFFGPLANVLGAVVFMSLAFMLGAAVVRWEKLPPRVGTVEVGSPAAAAGLEPGDLIVELNGEPVASWHQVALAATSVSGRPATIRVRRDGGEKDLVLQPSGPAAASILEAGVVPDLPTEIHRVVAGGAAERAGLQAGDVVRAIAGTRLASQQDFLKALAASAGKEIELTVERGGELVTLRATPEDRAGRGVLGVEVGPPRAFVKVSPWRAPVEAVRECVSMTRDTFVIIGRMITGRASIKQMSGPIDIARFSGEAARSGAVPLIWLLGVISLQLAIFNLLPIPVLDGGHLAVIAVESTIRRDLSWKVKERIMNVGFWLIIALVVVVLFNDVIKVLPQGILKLLPGH
jgi:regulator of sigma E protease